MTSPAKIARPAAPTGCVNCPKCSGSGDFLRLDRQSGRYVRMGACYACIGKGYQDRADVKRNHVYWTLNAERIAMANAYSY